MNWGAAAALAAWVAALQVPVLVAVTAGFKWAREVDRRVLRLEVHAGLDGRPVD